MSTTSKKERAERDDAHEQHMVIAQLISALPGTKAVMRDDEGNFVRYPVLLFVLREWPSGGEADIIGLISSDEGLQNAESVTGGEFIGYLAKGQDFDEFLADHNADGDADNDDDDEEDDDEDDDD